jgi:hypothetical protein
MATTNIQTFSGDVDVTSNLTVDTNTLHVDSVAGNVGIGSTNPTTKLHVYGNILGHPVIKTRTITKGPSLSDETDTFTLNPDENRIVLNNNQGSVGSTRRYRANFTSGVPTTVGTVLHLEINSQRVNTDATGRGHQSVIQFNGTSILDTGYIILSATGGKDSYDRKLQRTIILTDDGWKDYSMYPKISAPTTDDAIIFSTTEHATSTDLGNTELTERARITDTGNFGIGVTNPTRSLQIERGISYISGGTSNNSAFEIVQQLGTDDYTYLGQHRAQFRINSGVGSQSNRSLELALLDNGRGVMQANAGSEGYFPISINPVGAYDSTVSIGSYYSSAKLRVEGNVYATSTIQSAGEVYGTAFKNPTSTTYLGQSYSHPTEIQGGGHVRFISDAVERMRIVNTGNVGIGTAGPRQKLEVANGHIAIVQNAWKSEGVDDQLAGKIDFHLGNDSGQLATPVAAIEAYDKFQTGSSYRGDLAFKTMGNERMRLDSDGRMVLNGKCRAGNGFTTYEFTQSLAKQTWTNLFDLRSTLFAYGQTYISGTDYGISTGGHGVFYVYTDTGGYNYSYTALHDNGVSFRVSGNNLQAYWSSYLGGPRTIYFRYTVLNNRR